MVADKTRFTNRLTHTLKQYYPQALDWFDQRDTVLFCDFLTRWPTLAQVKRARQSSLKAFFHAHNGRRPGVIDARLDSIKAAKPLTEDLGVIVPCRLHAQVLVEQLRVTLQAIDRFDHEIAELAPTLPDYSLFQGLPGAGPHLAPRLLAAFGEDRRRFAHADELQKYAGIAPVTERSGKKSWVHWRWQCPTFVRQTFVEWAGQTINKSFWAGAYYRQQRDKGSSYQAAVRSLAFKWIRILYRCWQTNTPYDESRYLNALRKRRSPLLKNLVQATDHFVQIVSFGRHRTFWRNVADTYDWHCCPYRTFHSADEIVRLFVDCGLEEVTITNPAYEGAINIVGRKPVSAKWAGA